MTKEVTEINAGNEEIAIMLGYRLAKCNNGLAWESPFQFAIDDVLQIHGLLQRTQYSYMKFANSFDTLMPIVKMFVPPRGVIIDLVKEQTKLINALRKCDKEILWETLVNFAKKHNEIFKIDAFSKKVMRG